MVAARQVARDSCIARCLEAVEDSGDHHHQRTGVGLHLGEVGNCKVHLGPEEVIHIDLVEDRLCCILPEVGEDMG